MNILKNIFGTTKTIETPAAESVTTSTETPQAPNMEHLEKIFADNQPPVNNKEEKHGASPAEEPVINENTLKSFLNGNYYDRGFQDGYTYHSMEVHNAKVEVLINTYLELVEINISKLNDTITKYKIEIKTCQAAELEEQAVKLGHKAERYLEDLDKLKTERDLAPCKQGLISKPLSLYKEGYIRGMSQYHEDKLFAEPTGLFN